MNVPNRAIGFSTSSDYFSAPILRCPDIAERHLPYKLIFPCATLIEEVHPHPRVFCALQGRYACCHYLQVLKGLEPPHPLPACFRPLSMTSLQ